MWQYTDCWWHVAKLQSSCVFCHLFLTLCSRPLPMIRSNIQYICIIDIGNSGKINICINVLKWHIPPMSLLVLTEFCQVLRTDCMYNKLRLEQHFLIPNSVDVCLIFWQMRVLHRNIRLQARLKIPSSLQRKCWWQNRHDASPAQLLGMPEQRSTTSELMGCHWENKLGKHEGWKRWGKMLKKQSAQCETCPDIPS